jgi:hypothetical protein
MVDDAQARRISELMMSLERQPRADAIPRATVIADGPSLRAA